MKKRILNASLSTLMSLLLCFCPMLGTIAWADDLEQQSQVDTNVEAAVDQPSATEIPAADVDASESEDADSEPAEDLQQNVAPLSEEGTMNPVPDTPAQLVFGNKELADEDAFVLFISGDGFTSSEQDKFYEEAKKTADYIMETSPYDEFKDVIKIYAKGVISNESGARADNANTQDEANADTRDTFYGTSFWTEGMQRLLYLGDEGKAKLKEVKDKFVPNSDFEVLIVNSSTYGGSGGDICLASLNSSSLEMMLHELGHTIADLSDEYFAGRDYACENVNMSAKSDPAEVPWARFIGKNGIGVYEYSDGGNGWYKPSKNCKMQYLGVNYPFCEVCKEALRQAFCKDSNITKIFFQTYADQFNASEEGKDMREYFILRKGENEATGDTLGNAFHITYKDAEGNELEGAPSKAGDYTAVATFDGNDTYDACSLEAEYTIDLADLITLDAESKVFDGTPAKIDVEVDYDKEYELKYHYTGKIPYTSEIVNDYDSDEAPVKPGNYTVLVTAYDKESGEAVSRKSKEYSISFKTTQLANHDDDNYWGAAVYYNNKTIVLTGEGFTADEQDEFEKIAAEYVEYFRNTEPYKEMDIYFDYNTTEAVSDESGIGTTAKDTYFKLTYDENGKIVLPENGGEPAEAAKYIGYNLNNSYFTSCIVIVNDKNVKEGNIYRPSQRRSMIFTSPDKAGMEFAASEILNNFAGKEVGYRPSTDAEKAEIRSMLLKSIYYYWYGYDYSPVVSRAYDEVFVETGSPLDISPYVHTYISDKEVDMEYNITYYADNNGEPGEKLNSAPSKAGKYHAFCELVPTEPVDDYWGCTLAWFEDDWHYLVPARTWTSFKIYSIEELKQDPDKAIEGLKNTVARLEETKKNLEEAKVNNDAALEELEQTQALLEETRKNLEDANNQSAATEEALKQAQDELAAANIALEKANFKLKKATLVSLKRPARRAVKATWKTVSKADGYVIQYSRNKSFKNAKSVTVAGGSKTTRTIKGLKSKKRVYVRVRAYRNIGGSKVYTQWSSRRYANVK